MKRLTQNDILNKFTDEHGDFYDYSRVQYLHAKEKVEIICPTHGPFMMTPNNHLYGKQGCPTCAHKNRQMNNRGPRMSARMSQEEFVSRSRHVHGLVYNYTQSVYDTSHTKIDIICPKHGMFSQTPDQHINTGTGCPRCTYDNYVGGYSRQYFIDNPNMKESDGLLYLVNMVDGLESFYKIGITRRSIQKRFSGYSQTITPIFQHNMTIYSAFVIEQNILRQYNQYTYSPSHQFKGWTECFNLSCAQVVQLKTAVEDYTSQ